MGIASDLESAQQDITFGSPQDDDVLNRFDNHLSKIRHSLAAARKSMDQIRGLVNPREGNNKTRTRHCSGVLKSLPNDSLEHTHEQVAHARLRMGKQEHIDANPTERCQYVSVLTTEAMDVTAAAAPEARRIVSLKVDVNYNASDPAQSEEPESNIEGTLPQADVLDNTLPEEAALADTLPGEGALDDAQAEGAGLDQGREERTVLFVQAPEADAESLEEIILNPDLLPAPSIMITSATPFEQGPEDDAEEVIPKPSPVGSERRVNKQVSFNDRAIEEVILISQDPDTESGGSRRYSLDESLLDTAEKRKLDEETKKMSLKRSQSSDLVLKNATKLLEELQQANEAEAEAKSEADHPNADDSSVSDRSSHTKANIRDSLVLIETRSIGGLETDYDRLDTGISDMTVKSELDAASVTEEVVGQPKSLTQVLKSIDKVIYKDGVAMVWKKLSFSDEEVLVPVPPNSMLSDAAKSTQSDSIAEREVAKQPPREPCDDFLRRILGAPAYRHMFKTPKPPEVKSKIRGADWARQLKTQTFSARPPVLYVEEWKVNQMKKYNLGPGSYEIKDFIQLGNAKPRSDRGICDKLGPRFDKMTQSLTPGPGTYGIGGIPPKALEDHDNRSFSTKGMLDAGDRKRNLPVQKRTQVGPGYYSFKSFVDELISSKHNLRGRFNRRAQYPDVPTERCVLFSKAASSLDKDTPGPGTYEVKDLPRYTSVNPPGFLSSARRDDKMAERAFNMSCHPVGPGRYSTEKFEEPRVNAHTNVFKSKTGKPNLRMARFYEERLKTKQRNDETSASCPGTTNRSIVGM